MGPGSDPLTAVLSLAALLGRQWKSGGCALSSWRRRCRARVRRRSPPPSSLFLSFPSHPAARSGTRKIPENEKGGGRGSQCSTPGGHYFLLSTLRSDRPRVGDPPRALAPGPRECAPRIAAATTCLPHVASGSGERLGCLRAWGCGVGGWSLGTLSFL